MKSDVVCGGKANGKGGGWVDMEDGVLGIVGFVFVVALGMLAVLGLLLVSVVAEVALVFELVVAGCGSSVRH